MKRLLLFGIIGASCILASCVQEEIAPDIQCSETHSDHIVSVAEHQTRLRDIIKTVYSDNDVQAHAFGKSISDTTPRLVLHIVKGQ